MGDFALIQLMVNIKDGDLIYIIHDKRRQWVRKIKKDTKFHCDQGFLEYNSIIGKPYGKTYFLSPNQRKVAILKPTISDTIFHMKRESQIIYPEDIGLILIFGDIHPGCKILEAGTGSGTVSGIFGIYTLPDGMVNTYDVREVAISQAKKNLQRMNIEDHVSVQYGNILQEEFQLSPRNFIMLDMATPWNAVKKVRHLLDPKGRICLFSPTLEQVKKNVKALQSSGFPKIITLEQLQRKFQVKPNATRPSGRMIGHTGYLTFASLETGSILSDFYSMVYSPSNIGNLIIYGNIRPDTQCLILTTSNSPIKQIFTTLFGENMNHLFVEFPESQLVENFVETVKERMEKFRGTTKDTEFNTILVDNIVHSNLVQKISGLLEKSGVFISLSQDIEHMKIVNDQLHIAQYYEILSWELICREISVNTEKNSVYSTHYPQQGYLTIGRKVIDELEEITRKPAKPEFIEPLLDVAVKFAEECQPEPEKIDYANIREETA